MNKIELIEQAQEHINCAIELLQQACKNDSSAQNYIIAPLKIIASSNHPYYSNEPNLDDLIERYNSDDEDEQDEQDEN